ncbi:WD40 repeat-like protein, partial [Polyporus arcularius HHB13444]
RLVLHGHTAQINAACVSPCERYIATASHDATVRLWSARDGALLWTFRDHNNWVSHVIFSPDGKFLVSADGCGGVRIRPLVMFV